MLIGVVGTAGRKDDYAKLNRKVYFAMYNKLLQLVPDTKFDVVSGGAAWADHLAVSLFLRGEARGLSLYLPAEFDMQAARYKEEGFRSPGSISNYYHDRFTKKMRQNSKQHSLTSIRNAIRKGAEVHVFNGFFNGNHKVGSCDTLIAFTFGRHSGTYSGTEEGWADPYCAGLKDGGTAHTWKNSNAPVKIHCDIHELLG